jgi:hypothetical protein
VKTKKRTLCFSVDFQEKLTADTVFSLPPTATIYGSSFTPYIFPDGKTRVFK